MAYKPLEVDRPGQGSERDDGGYVPVRRKRRRQNALKELFRGDEAPGLFDEFNEIDKALELLKDKPKPTPKVAKAVQKQVTAIKASLPPIVRQKLQPMAPITAETVDVEALKNASRWVREAKAEMAEHLVRKRRQAEEEAIIGLLL